MKYEFTLNEKQEKELDDWLAKIEDLCGSCGGLTFTFKPSSIGEEIYVRSSMIEKELDLSHEEDW